MTNSTANSTPNTTMIVPCAGFGTRVGSPPAKELLVNPSTQRPLIDHSLSVAQNHHWNKVFITRPEKKILMDYVTNWEVSQKIKTQWVIVQKTAEWPESVLKSAEFWSEKNILILPDTSWDPAGIENEIVRQLDYFDVCYGLFDVPDKQTWGTVSIQEGALQLCEKPFNANSDFKAWGLIAFKKNVGKILFKSILESTMDHHVKSLQLKACAIIVNSFTDHTRSKQI